MNHFEELIAKVKSLGLPKNDFAIFGSAHLYLCGLRDTIGDIDIIARGAAWEKACTLSKPEVPKSKLGLSIVLFDGEIEIFDNWVGSSQDIDTLIDTAKEIDNLRFVTLENILEWKSNRNSPKDIPDIRKIKEYLKITI